MRAFVVIVALFVACGGNSERSEGADTGPEPMELTLPDEGLSADESLSADELPAEVVAVQESETVDAFVEDEPVSDIAPDPTPDVAPEKVSPEEVLQQDISNLSENAQACLYVVTSLCSKILIKCDLLGLLPTKWMDSCTQFLLNNEKTIALACAQLDNAESSDPTISLILSFGPEALKNCADNFQCTLENIMQIVNFVTPLFSGTKVDTATILNLVVTLCFPK